jgi:excisionase family DNA binding protein
MFTERGTWSPVGKPVASPPERSVPAMPQNLSGDISEVKFLTVAEVAAMMRVSKMTVYRLVHNGDLPAVRVGRSFRVTEDDVNEYLRKSFYSAG